MIMRGIVELSDREDVLFMLDTGDFVLNGSYSDQFWSVMGILGIAPDLPYLVAIGNHETHFNRTIDARRNTATFLAYLDEGVDADRLYYSKSIGPVRYIFLDSNDLVYGDDGRSLDEDQLRAGSRGEAQMQWLVEQLDSDAGGDIATTVVGIHHPFVQSSEKHRGQAKKLWNMQYGGRTLPEILLDGGVDLVLVGHTHTYESFRIARADGSDEMWLVNISGRPRDNKYGLGEGARRAEDIAGEEHEFFEEQGWSNLDDYTIVQEDAMVEDELNQFALVTVEPDGGILLEMYFVSPDSPESPLHDPTIRLK
jgi:3',5'-cyclic AMP phosphodiesterase CpdA